ncbi:cysteine desulfurase NifS [Anaerofilum sp. BX8]|uniref:Cysteine desulfurase IscS n=1 Tax=Anaerofilum hominis TaxID=2763016 RepID=A0A923I813_9FIRM|nr:cysteine desulfurase NifS [Anaerofilum hominis]MBC5581986.1 cysteine desulfurase NifS [Anaerofilum hominis]
MEQTGKIIYLDNAATTPVSGPVLDAMLPYFSQHYGNPSSVYGIARQSKEALDAARTQVAAALNCLPEEVFFTGCGSESDNWAVKGIAHKLAAQGKRHLITTSIEHHAILHSMAELEKEGFEVTYLPVDADGLVSPDQVRAAIRPDTALVSVMYANNEIGTVEPVAEIGAVCREAGVLFHTDAVQAAGTLKINVQAQKIDALSLSAHKFNGPKGVGALYLKKGLRLPNLIDGGGQENGRRAGTENVAGIVGLGKALELANAQLAEKAVHLEKLRDYVIRTVRQSIPNVKLNGHPTRRLPGNVNLSFEGIEGEGMLLLLDMKGVCASSGSACTSGSLDPSHVLLAIGLPHEIAHGSLRLTFGPQNTMEDAQAACSALQEIIPRLRAMSPVWDKIEKGEAKPLLG